MVELTEEQIRKFMELSVEVMKNSIQEKRHDEKPSPFVGAVMVREDMSVVTAYRGELREGDHAEFTLLERKCRSENVEGNVLFATLEPCSPGARHFPKLGCAERIVNFTLPRNAAAVNKVDDTLAELDEGEIRMLNFFRLNDSRAFAKSEVVEKLGIYPRTAERELKHLVDLDLLIREGVGRSTAYRIAIQ